jgi:hypothetical protein
LLGIVTIILCISSIECNIRLEKEKEKMGVEITSCISDGDKNLVWFEEQGCI